MESLLRFTIRWQAQFGCTVWKAAVRTLSYPSGWRNPADGPWTKKLVFADYALGQERPLGVLSEVDLATSRVSPAFTDLDLVDFDSPVFDPSGVWMAVAGQSLGEGSARSIWIVRLDESQKLRITSDPLASQAAYHWDFSGKRLVYQEYRLGNSENKPSIFVWDLQTRKAQLVAENAALPAWVR